MWTARAIAETQAAPRTWFVTLTFRPEQQVRFMNLARARLARQGADFDALPFGEQFSELVRYAGPEVTMFLKRVRKASRKSFRYLCVAEHHKSGLPHYHLLIHELELGDLKHAVLSGQWSRCGFEQTRLVSDVKQAAYLCKYLSKTSVARVRASGGYGGDEYLIRQSSEALAIGLRSKRERKRPPKLTAGEARALGLTGREDDDA